ncbi:MAG: phosphotransacetylase family protein [Anaerolineae bacterium]|nr:phosphotransacetylase family protein [Anaerolineae bacterium]
MKALYITSIDTSSGKTAVCLGLGKRLQIEGKKVGYVKPISYEVAQLGGEAIDEDVTFVKNVLNLDLPPQELSAVVVTPEVLRDCLASPTPCNFEEQIVLAMEKAAVDKDVLLIEGGGSLRQGYVLNLSTPYVAELLGAKVLAVVRYTSQLTVLDDVLTAEFRLKDRLLGVIINRVPEEGAAFLAQQGISFLEKHGVPVFGVLPERRNLSSISVSELVDTLDAEVLAAEDRLEGLVEELMVGAMGAQEALSRFRAYRNKAVITGGDRTDMQLAALETSTACLILTGNLTPSASVIDRANDQHVPVLLVKRNTIETIEQIEKVFGKTRLGQAEKLAHFESLMAEHVDYRRLFKEMGL